MKTSTPTQLFFCLFALFATQELQAAPYISNLANESTSATSQLLGTRTYNADRELISHADSDRKLTYYTYNSANQLKVIEDRNENFIYNIYNYHELLQSSWVDKIPGSTAPDSSATNLLEIYYDKGNDLFTGTTYHQNPKQTVISMIYRVNFVQKLIIRARPRNFNTISTAQCNHLPMY